MKKIFIIALLLLTCVFFAACSGNTTTADQTWASTETLSFSVYDTERGAGNVPVGEATFSTTTILTAEEKASGADTKVTAVVTVDTQTTTTIFYAKVYNVLSLKRTFVDTEDASANYILEGRHKDKNFIYETTYADNRKESGKIKVGSSNYTDFEFLYFYIRCYDPSSLPSVTVPDLATGEAVALTCSRTATAVTVKTETELNTTGNCYEVAINRKSTPVGSPSYVYYLSDEAFSAGEGSMIKSTRLPVKIVENNVSFVLKDYNPKK